MRAHLRNASHAGWHPSYRLAGRARSAVARAPKCLSQQRLAPEADAASGVKSHSPTP